MWQNLPQEKMASSVPQGKIYVGKYWKAAVKPLLPKGVRGILSHTAKGGLAGDLSPYNLTDGKGRILENLWQFSKVYPKVTAQRQAKSRFHPGEIIWEHPAQKHLTKEGELTPAFWEWRRKGMRTRYPVRYPNGFHGRHTCAFSIPLEAKVGRKSPPHLGYIEARKSIYCQLYINLTQDHASIAKLRKLLNKGVSICLIEVDGPDPDAYIGTSIHSYFDQQALLINQEVIEYLVNDPSHPFGHGFTLAAILAGIKIPGTVSPLPG